MPSCVSLSVTLVGMFLSITVFSIYVFLLIFSYGHWDARFFFGCLFLIILVCDLFFRIRLAVGRNFYEGKWDRKARLYAGFGTLYLLLPLVWTFSDDIMEYYGVEHRNMNLLYTVDKNIILGTVAFNLVCSLF